MIGGPLVMASLDGSDAITVYILHGIMGSRRNWRGFAGILQKARPSWRLVLTDLRCHGHSRDVAGPHSLRAASDDVWRMAQELGLPDRVLGHSFGGKVALQLAQDNRESVGAPWQTWVLDCPMSAVVDEAVDESEVGRVISMLKAIPSPITRRSDVQVYFESVGFSRALSGWMTTNVERAADGTFQWRFHVDGVAELLKSYWAADFYTFLERGGSGVELVIAEQSDRWTARELAKVSTLETNSSIGVHRMPNAGHWLHVDDPAGLVEVLE